MLNCYTVNSVFCNECVFKGHSTVVPAKVGLDIAYARAVITN